MIPIGRLIFLEEAETLAPSIKVDRAPRPFSILSAAILPFLQPEDRDCAERDRIEGKKAQKVFEEARRGAKFSSLHIRPSFLL